MANGKAGPPAKVLTKEQIAQFEHLAPGMTCKELAQYFDMGQTTFIALKGKNVEIDEAYKKYRTKGISKAFGVLWDIIMSKSPQSLTAVMFYLKTQAGYRERQEVGVGVGENTVGKLLIQFSDTNKEKKPKKKTDKPKKKI